MDPESINNKMTMPAVSNFQKARDSLSASLRIFLDAALPLSMDSAVDSGYRSKVLFDMARAKTLLKELEDYYGRRI
jgi:hypothetical protein